MNRYVEVVTVTRAARLTREEWGIVNAALSLYEAEIDDPSEYMPEKERRELQRELDAVERLRQKVLQRLR